MSKILATTCAFELPQSSVYGVCGTWSETYKYKCPNIVYKKSNHSFVTEVIRLYKY